VGARFFAHVHDLKRKGVNNFKTKAANRMDWKSVVGAVEPGTRLWHQYGDDDDDDDDGDDDGAIVVYHSCYKLLKFLL
jgi:hypothetical protein